MDLSVITKKVLSEISDEVKKEDNMNIIKHDILDPIIRHIIDELYPYFIKISMDYFSQTAELNPFMHTWSLGVEEQFYFLFHLIVWYKGFGRSKKFSEKKLLIIICFLSLF